MRSDRSSYSVVQDPHDNPLVWTDTDKVLARSDGWFLRVGIPLVPDGIFASSHHRRFEKCDGSAFDHVQQRAAEGSPLHQKALRIFMIHKLSPNRSIG